MCMPKNPSVHHRKKRVPLIGISRTQMAVMLIASHFRNRAMVRDNDSFPFERIGEFTDQKIKRIVVSLNHVFWSKSAIALLRSNHPKVIHPLPAHHRRCENITGG